MQRLEHLKPTAQNVQISTKQGDSRKRLSPCFIWSGRLDSNQRPLDPQLCRYQL